LGRRTGTGKDVVAAELLDGELSHFLAGGKMSGELSNGDIVRLFYDGWNSGDINFGDLVARTSINASGMPAEGKIAALDEITRWLESS
jgi:hypothetical protein